MQNLARPAAAFIALTGAVSLVGQYAVTRALPNFTSAPDVLWRMAGYFTVLVNILVVLHFAQLATGRKRPGKPGSATAGLVLSIIVVGLAYHTLLAGIWSPVGLAWWADQGLHTAVPILSLAWWLFFAPKAGLSIGDLAVWLLIPLVYCTYAITRGALSGFWAYPFLDPGLVGAKGVAINSAGMMVGFAVLGLGMLALARRLVR
jgi:hypothetical protein